MPLQFEWSCTAITHVAFHHAPIAVFADIGRICGFMERFGQGTQFLPSLFPRHMHMHKHVCARGIDMMCDRSFRMLSILMSTHAVYFCTDCELIFCSHSNKHPNPPPLFGLLSGNRQILLRVHLARVAFANE